MTGYVLIAFLVIFTGIYFMAYNLNSGYPYFSYVLMNINYVLIIIIPMLTMRSFGEIPCDGDGICGTVPDFLHFPNYH